jgi:flagellar motor switch protein FliM
MGGEVLSQQEVESLLSAMEGRGAAGGPASGGARPGSKVSPYDFKRPERVGKEQMRSLQTMHEGFGRNFGAALSALLRTIVEVKLTSVDQLTYSEFVFSLENPTCFNLINAPPLEGQLILDVNLSLLYPIIDRLLGGNGEHAPPLRRPLTEIELRLVSRITNLFLSEMKHAWENVLVLEPSVDRVESNPQLVQIVPPNEVVVLISFEVTLGEVRGMANLCITYNSIERISQKLTSNSWVAYGRKPPTPQSIQQISRQLTGSQVEVVVELAETHVATSDLIGLQVGDVITTEKDIHQPLVLSIEGRPKFHTEAGVYKGRKAVQVTGAIGQMPPSREPPSAPFSRDAQRSAAKS